MDRFSHEVIIISKNLDGFSLANHGRFTKFAKFFPRQTFPLYGISLSMAVLNSGDHYYGFSNFSHASKNTLQKCDSAICKSLIPTFTRDFSRLYDQAKLGIKLLMNYLMPESHLRSSLMPKFSLFTYFL